MTHTRIPRQRGFTVVEILVIVTTIGLLVTPVIGGIMFFYGNIVTSNRQAQLNLESQHALRLISEELRIAASIRANNAISDVNSPAGGWVTSNSGKVLVIATPALNASNNFIIDTSTSKPYQNEIVYFASGKTLYKRTLANASAAGNRTKTTCPAALATPSCPADIVLSTRFSTFNFTFYDAANVATSTASAARSIELLLTLTDQLYGRTITYDNTIRITLRNTN